MQILRWYQATSMHWKNGRGTTQQIRIRPSHAQFPTDPFVWRISAAGVHAQDRFSQFPGYRRWLVIWRGQGFKLNGDVILPFQPLQFDGGDLIDCELLDGAVTDLGLIYDPKKCSATLSVLEFTDTDSKELFNNGDEPMFLFCAQGSVSVGPQTLEEGDTLQLDAGEAQTITTLNMSKLILINLKTIDTL